MGQYFRAVILNHRNNSLEHVFSPHDTDDGSKIMEHFYIGNPFVEEVENFLLNNPNRLVWAGDYAEPEPDTEGFTLYELSKKVKTTKPRKCFDSREFDGAYVINHDKKQFYLREPYNEEAWQVNPLPLLTYEGEPINYFDEHSLLIGTWSRDNIELSFSKPDDSYQEITPKFKSPI